MNRDNIFLCIPTLRNAGAERFVTELACTINRERYSVHVVVTGIFEANTAFYQKLIDEEIEVVDATANNYVKQIAIIRKLLRHYKPVIVHSNVSSALHIILPLALSGVKAKHLFTTHSMGYRIFAGIKKKLMGFCFSRSIVVPVAICDTVKKSLEEAYGLPEKKIECVYNGVDTDRFNKKSIKEDSVFTFVCVGTLYHIKNHAMLIESFKYVKDKINSTKLVLVGDGELRKELELQVDRLELTDNVVFAGNQSDVVAFLSNADVYCCASKIEGLPISVLEAMACSLPVITTPAGGVVDIIQDGINGFVVEADPSLYAEKMLKLAQDSQLRIDMSEKSRELAIKYDLKNCAREYENLYKKYTHN